MTELALIIAIDFAGLLFAALLGRSVMVKEVRGAELLRLGAALRRASEALSWKQLRIVAWISGTLGLTIFSLFSYFGYVGNALGGFDSAVYATLGLWAGAAATSVVALLAAYLGRSASLRLVTAARVHLDQALAVSMYAGGAAGLTVQCLSGLSLAVYLGLVFALRGGMGAGMVGGGRQLAMGVTLLSPAFALGAAGAALVWHRTGAVFHAAGDLAADLGGEQRARLPHDDARNPALVADLVGDHVGPGVGHSVDLFLSVTMANVVSAIVGASLMSASSSPRIVAALVVLPFLVGAFGIVASISGLMVVRSQDDGRPVTALWRGQASTVIVLVAGLTGASVWLVQEYWWRFVASGVLGLTAALAIGHGLRYLIGRRLRALRDLVEAERVAEAAGLAHGIGAGLERAILPASILGLALSAAWLLGVSTGIPGAGLPALMTALMAMLALSPYLLAVSTLGSIADSARGALGLIPGQAPEEVARRTSAIDDAGWVGGNVSQSTLGVAGGIAALLVATCLPLSQGGSVIPWTALGLDISQPIVLWSGVLGVAVVLGCAGNLVRTSARAARLVLLEVERQLRRFRVEGEGRLPTQFTPSYRGCIELSNRLASTGTSVSLGLALLVPGFLGFGLGALPESLGRGLARASLTSFVMSATVTALCLTFAFEGTRAVLATARRLHRTLGTSPLAAALTGDAIADLFGNVAAPGAQLVVKTAAVAALVIAPFIR